ncbi:MAG TPA: S8 family serine peptidase, partial [Solirubrobacteraceae bacterium]|nr:S8 family serine peptidase [Solirubrobacteraceae bacterium]
MDKTRSHAWRPFRLGIVGAVVVAGALIMSGLASGPASRARNNDVSPSAQRGPQTGVLANGAKTRAGSPASSHAPYRAGAVLVSFRPGVSGASQTTIERAAGALDARRLGPAVRRVGAAGAGRQLASAPILLRVPSSGVLSAVRTLRGDPHVAYAEPDYLMHASATPNDPSFALQWAANNTGQSIPTQNAEEVQGPPANGTAGADDRALAAWGVSTGSRSIVIGETDTGVNYNHADLASNVWTNPGGIGGCAAGTRGYNVLNSTCEPMDDDTAYGGHGTHVAGIMGAVGNNGAGVAGMNWQTSILPVKWLNSSASGSTSGLIAALQWLVAAKQAGVNLRVVNDSATFVGTAYSQALSEEIDTLGANNILFVTAAGNTGDNNDLEAVRRYPCGYDRPSEICATASNNNDSLPSWANYGSHTVDLAAPGVSVYSTLRNGGYGYLSGGSMASPQVAGAAALILSVSPSLSPSALKSDILENVDKLPSLAGKVITGGRLDVCKALPGCTTPPPTLTFGKTTVGASSDSFLADRKRVSRYSLSAAGSVTKLSMYLAPTGTSGQQVLKGLVYADASGKPGALVGVSEQLTFKSTNAAGWYDLVFSSPLKLAAGTYWIGAMTGASSNVAGFRYDNVPASRDYNANTYTSGPSDPFGSVSTDGEQASLYATYTSQSLPPPPADTAPPTISGTAQQGQTLTEAHGTWTNSPTNFTYQWLQCDSSGNACTAIAKAISQTYVPVAADVGHTLKVQETAANQGGPGAPASSGATGVVKATPPPPPPANTTPPTVSGTAQQGQTLTEAHGSWTNSPTGYTYQWLQCDSSGNGCTAIAKATSQTYVPAAEDVGHTLRAQETAANEGGPSSPASSSASAIVLPAPPANTAAPTITGTAQQGQTLTEAHGSWTNSPTSFAYQWLQCESLGSGCVPIAGATHQTYVPVAEDVGHTLKVQETAANSGGSGSAASSAATAVVKGNPPPPPANTAPPTISGTAQQGQTLTEAHGTWTNSPTGFAYQWLQCDSSGNACTAIASATGQTYVPVAADVAHTLKVQETAANSGGSGSPASSGATAIV